MMRTALLVTALLITLADVSAAGTKQVRYAGIHPVPAAEGGGICHLEALHVHIYAADRLQYREHGGTFVFVGDPIAYGYDGPRYAYKGHHPIDLQIIIGGDDHDVEWCYLDGPHFHPFTPTGEHFVLTGGAFFYVAKPPKAYLDARRAMLEINTIYRPMVYTRPVVTVAAPAGWIGARVDIMPRPRSVGRPVRVSSPDIWVELGVVAPGVVIYDDHDHHHRYRRHHKHRKFKHHDHDDD